MEATLHTGEASATRPRTGGTMNIDTLHRLDRMYDESPMMRAGSVPTNDEVNAASQKIGVPFPSDYCEFLLRYGSSVVGPYPVFGLRESPLMDDRWSVVDVTNEFRSSCLESVSHWIVFSEDHAGNPIGMDADGVVWKYDHDCAGIAELAPSFEAYLRTQCLKLNS